MVSRESGCLGKEQEIFAETLLRTLYFPNVQGRGDVDTSRGMGC
jgi:hypothetical protein